MKLNEKDIKRLQKIKNGGYQYHTIMASKLEKLGLAVAEYLHDKRTYIWKITEVGDIVLEYFRINGDSL